MSEHTPLWCLHHIGADELHPAPDFETAQRWADYANHAFYAPDVSRFVVALWPSTPDRHAADLENSITDWSCADGSPVATPQDILAEALTACRDQFDFYAREHRAAGKHEKAATNERFAFLATQALTKAQATPHAG